MTSAQGRSNSVGQPMAKLHVNEEDPSFNPGVNKYADPFVFCFSFFNFRGEKRVEGDTKSRVPPGNTLDAIPVL